MKIPAFFWLVASLSVTAVSAQDDYPPGTFQLTPVIDLNLQPVAVPIPNQFDLQDDLVLNLPPGFTANIFAAGGMGRPRFMAFDDAGVLHVADMGSRDEDSRIFAFPDRDGDGVADERILVANDMRWVHSLAFYDGDMYAAESHRITRFRDADGDGTYEMRETIVDDIPSFYYHHTRTIVFDEAKEKIYLSVGSPCDFCRQDEPVEGSSSNQLPASDEWGTILEFNIDGSGRRVFANGIRNVVGLTRHPVSGELWGTHNGWDRGGDHLPPEWIDIIRDGDFMGHPFVYGYQAWVDFNLGNYNKVLPITLQDSLLAQRQKRPAALIPAHLAPMGIHFYTRDQFPEMYRNAAFVAIHGGKVERNLAVVPGFKVVALFSEPDGSNARMGDFMTGFERGPLTTDIWGKPMGIVTDKEGFLYVSSDLTNKAIIRIGVPNLSGNWEQSLPDTAVSSAMLDLEATVFLNKRDPDAGEPELVADLSDLGGPTEVALVALGDDLYQLKTSFAVEAPNGFHQVRVHIRQPTDEGAHEMVLVGRLLVLPGADLNILADGLGTGWRVESPDGGAVLDIAATAQVHDGEAAIAINSDGPWEFSLIPPEPVPLLGYTALSFAFHPGDVRTGSINLINNDSSFPRAGDLALRGFVDLELPEWQVVESPLESLRFAGTLEQVGFKGNWTGTIYLDDIRLVAPMTEGTAILETATAEIPDDFGLHQNFPNPFNSDTILRFDLSGAAVVDLALYNLAGQRIATLSEGYRAAGRYTVRWDGRDGRGRELASGVYAYRLRAGSREQTRKLLLLR